MTPLSAFRLRRAFCPGSPADVLALSVLLPSSLRSDVSSFVGVASPLRAELIPLPPNPPVSLRLLSRGGSSLFVLLPPLIHSVTWGLPPQPDAVGGTISWAPHLKSCPGDARRGTRAMSHATGAARSKPLGGASSHAAVSVGHERRPAKRPSKTSLEQGRN